MKDKNKQPVPSKENLCKTWRWAFEIKEDLKNKPGNLEIWGNIKTILPTIVLRLNFSEDHQLPCGVVANVPDCDIVINEFELKSRNYIHFRINAFGKRYKPPYSPSYGFDSTTPVLQA